MRRLIPIALILMTSCYFRPYHPYYAAAPIAQPQAVNIAYGFAQSRGLAPSGVRYAVYHGRRNYWQVMLFLAAPNCGEMRVDVAGYGGEVIGSAPYVHPCGGYIAPPPGAPPPGDDD